LNFCAIAFEAFMTDCSFMRYFPDWPVPPQNPAFGGYFSLPIFIFRGYKSGWAQSYPSRSATAIPRLAFSFPPLGIFFLHFFFPFPFMSKLAAVLGFFVSRVLLFCGFSAFLLADFRISSHFFWRFSPIVKPAVYLSWL